MIRLVAIAVVLGLSSDLAATELRVLDRLGTTVVTVQSAPGGLTVLRDKRGRTVGRIVKEPGGGLAIRDRRGRTVARIKESKR